MTGGCTLPQQHAKQQARAGRLTVLAVPTWSACAGSCTRLASTGASSPSDSTPPVFALDSCSDLTCRRAGRGADAGTRGGSGR